MKRDVYDKQLIKWVKNHYWDSLEKDKDLILRHLRTFAGDETPPCSCSWDYVTGESPNYFCGNCGGAMRS